MTKVAFSLDDKFDLSRKRVLLTGAQAVVRLAIMQRVRDVRSGLNTAGYVTGYRGSPIAGLEAQFARAADLAADHHIVFHPGLNEDLAATALWGTQQAELRGEGKYDGVFGIWYGKGPGVDRSGDVFRHANHAGTSKHGGVLALMGDDHTCESSTSAHQSEFAFVDAMMPVLNPGNVQEIIDFGLYGFAMSRYAGVWVGIKCVKDNFESTSNVYGDIDRITINFPDDHVLPHGGLNIRLGDSPLDREARLHDHKRDAVLAFARANGLDQIALRGGPAPRIGIVSTGKSYLDTLAALDHLGIDEARAADLGIRLYKVAMPWPLEPAGLAEFARGLELIIVVEEKRSLIETQIKEQLYGTANAPRVIGKKDGHERVMFHAKAALDSTEIAVEIGERVMRLTSDDGVGGRLDFLKRRIGNSLGEPEAVSRVPYFCAGCPHNTSTVIPDGARAYAGIGCHYMAQWMDRGTDGFTQMGAEGANWIGEAPFSKRGHVFQNLGDGTYIHSGSLAVRAAIAAGTNMTYKILYNDAVAMTGGQPLDGGLTVPDIARQMAAEGAKQIAVVSDEPDKYAGSGAVFPSHVGIHHRDELELVQRSLAKVPGVTVLIYDQTCAAEKRRRRKRGLYPDPPKRAFINTAVCEGCGDCGIKSNCVAILPDETEFGRKRRIDQSACNKDFSCVDGFCPSFVTVHGGRLRRSRQAVAVAQIDDAVAAIPEPAQMALEKPYSIVITGVGGTGVVTLSAILGQAAHIEHKGFGAIDMAGLAQKGGAVACHTRIAAVPEDIHAIRIGRGGANLVLGCDLVVTASNKVLETVDTDHTAFVVNSYEMMTGDFTRQPDMRLPIRRLEQSIRDQAGKGHIEAIDAHHYATQALGDSILSNMLMLGFAWQLGLIPLGFGSIQQAIELNGVAVDMNKRAFALGRLAAHDRDALDGLFPTSQVVVDESLEAIIERRVQYLTDYQDADYGARYGAKLAWVRSLENKVMAGREDLSRAVAGSYFKMLAYKDEYEVARLFTDPAFRKSLHERFEGDYTLSFYLAPPFLAALDPVTGLPKKRRFGPMTMKLFGLLAPLKRLRGTRFDPFGYSKDRRLERQLIEDYEGLLDEIASNLTQDNFDTAVELADAAQGMRGFGHVKRGNVEQMKIREAELLKRLKTGKKIPKSKAA